MTPGLLALLIDVAKDVAAETKPGTAERRKADDSLDALIFERDRDRDRCQ